MGITSINLAIVFFALFINNVYSSTDYCFSTDPIKSQLSSMGAETAYNRVSGTSDQVYEYPGCKRVKLWSLNRHGTKFANDEKTFNSFQLLPQIQNEIVNGPGGSDSLCDEDYLLIANWNMPDFTFTQAQNLAEQGRQDIKSIARAYNKLFPDLVKKQYSPDNFQFAIANRTLCLESYRIYVTELFGKKEADSIKVVYNDKLLQPNLYCNQYKEAGQNVKQLKFINSVEFQNLRKDVSKKLGLSRQLNNNEILAMWNMCVYEAAVYVNEDSAWCAAFDKKQAEILDYNEDLIAFYNTGPGSKINFIVPYAAILDMLNNFETSNNLPNVINYFTREQTIHFFLDALEAFTTGIPLTDNNYNQQKYRHFKSSDMTPFAANLVAVKYECQAGNDKVLFLLNEKPLDLGWCYGYCSWSELKHRLSAYNAKVDEQLCQ